MISCLQALASPDVGAVALNPLPYPLHSKRIEGVQRGCPLYNVAVVGATGLVGQEFLKIAAQRRFPIKGLRLLASHRSAGKKLTVGEWAVEVEEATSKSFQGVRPRLLLGDDGGLARADPARREGGRHLHRR